MSAENNASSVAEITEPINHTTETQPVQESETATDSTQKKSKSKKKYAVIAIVLVIVIFLIAKISGGGSSDAEEVVKEYLQTAGYQVSDINTEYEAKYKVKNEYDRWEKAVYSLVTAKVQAMYDADPQYVLVSCEICESDTFADIDIECQTDSKAVLKNATRTNIKDTKQLLKDAKDTGELR